MKRLFNSIILSSVVVMPLMATGNPGTGDTWNWGANETVTKGYWMNMERLVKINKYEEATVPLVKLLESAPELNLALYINAIKVYEKRTFAEKNPAKKEQLADSTLMLYEKRIALFGDEANVLNREGRVAWNFLSNRANTSERLFDLYSKIYELNKNNTYPENLYSYMKAGCVRHMNKALSKEEVIEVFTKCDNALTAQLTDNADNKEIEKINNYKAKVNGAFSSKVKIDCGDIQSLFDKQFVSNENEATAKSIVSLSAKNKCFSTDALLRSAEYLIKTKQANYTLFKLVGDIYVLKNENEKANIAFIEALGLTQDSVKKAQLNFALAQLEAKKGNNLEAKKFALAAVDLDASFIMAYTFIGDLYFNNANTCSTGDVVKDRSIYIAAFNMYSKAGNNAGIAQSKAQFPSMEELFLISKKPGDNLNTGCWINENVVLQIRN